MRLGSNLVVRVRGYRAPSPGSDPQHSIDWVVLAVLVSFCYYDKHRTKATGEERVYFILKVMIHH